MRCKARITFLLWLPFVAAPLVAAPETFESEEARALEKQDTPTASRCRESPFASGCMGSGFGPVISSDSQGLVYGAAANFTYFIANRLGASLGGGAIFASTYQDYSAGPALTYYIGPFAGYILTPSISATKHYIRGSANLEGWAYGPSIGILTNLFGRVYWGISFGYYTYDIAGYKSSDWNWSPVVFIPF